MQALSRLLADRGYDANSLRRRLRASTTEAVIPSTRSRKTPIPHDAAAYVDRNRIERAFCRLKDWPSPAGLNRWRSLARHRHPLRQACQKLRIRRRHRPNHSLVDLNESRP